MPLLDTLRALLPWRRKAYPVPTSSGGGWWSIIREPFTGAWQRNIQIDRRGVDAFHADFACKTLIARDIAKLRIKLVQRGADGIWSEVSNAAFSPVLRKPNHFQTRNQFIESWILSKLSRGNTYVLKARDNRRVVVGLFVLDPDRVQVLVADDDSVFYRLSSQDLLGSGFGDVTVPATEVIHDRFNTLYHKLVGVPPIFASGLAAMQGINIQSQSVRLFENNSQPGGILTAPGHIEDDTAARLKKHWEENFGGNNSGRVAVLGDDLKYAPMAMTAEQTQLIEQLKWTAEVVCSTYHVPPYKIGVGAMPSYNNVQALNVEYYAQGLQSLIEDAEACLDDGLGLGEQYDLGVEFDLTGLLRMDGVSQADFVSKLVAGSILTPNEARAMFDRPPLRGGNTVYMQQQNYSLEALAKRDAQDDPFATSKAPAAAPPADPPAPGGPDDEEGDEPMDEETAKAADLWRLQKALDAMPAIVA